MIHNTIKNAAAQYEKLCPELIFISKNDKKRKEKK